MSRITGDNYKNVRGIEYRFLNELAKRYPVMTNAGFDFPFPLCGPEEYTGELDSVASLGEFLRIATEMRSKLSSIGISDFTPEERIRYDVLFRNISLLILMFSEIEHHKRDPTLPIRIIMNALDLSQDESTIAVIENIPGFLERHQTLDVIYHPLLKERAYLLRGDLSAILRNIFNDHNGKSRYYSRDVRRIYDDAETSLHNYVKFVRRSNHDEKLGIGEKKLKRMLDLYGVIDLPDDIWSWACNQYDYALREVKCAGIEASDEIPGMSGNGDWRQILNGQKSGFNPDLRTIYERERDLLYSLIGEVVPLDEIPPIEIRETPREWRNVIPGAVYEPDYRRNIGILYLTARRRGQPRKFTDPFIFRKVLTAHENGHHIQDFSGKRNKGLISAAGSLLNIEGLPSYIEGSVAGSVGYYGNPVEVFKERVNMLRRAARLKMEIGIHTEHLTYEDAIRMFMKIGMPEREARTEFYDAVLIPSSKLAYRFGEQQYETLRDYALSRRLTLIEYHQIILDAGKIGFDLIKRIIDNHSPVSGS